jgi:large subunit ribosomal protein L29
MPKKENLGEKSSAALLNGLSDAKRELFNLRFQLATGQLENTARLKEVRKDIARLNTEIRAREIEAAEGLLATSAASASPAEGAS